MKQSTSVWIVGLALSLATCSFTWWQVSRLEKALAELTKRSAESDKRLSESLSSIPTKSQFSFLESQLAQSNCKLFETLIDLRAGTVNEVKFDQTPERLYKVNKCLEPWKMARSIDREIDGKAWRIGYFNQIEADTHPDSINRVVHPKFYFGRSDSGDRYFTLYSGPFFQIRDGTTSIKNMTPAHYKKILGTPVYSTEYTEPTRVNEAGASKLLLPVQLWDTEYGCLKVSFSTFGNPESILYTHIAEMHARRCAPIAAAETKVYLE